MSSKVSGLIWEVGPCERNQRFVLLALADNAGDDGYCFPSVATIAKKCLFTERHIVTATQQLEAAGWLQVMHRAKGKRNAYIINVEKLEDLKQEARIHEKASSQKRPKPTTDRGNNTEASSSQTEASHEMASHEDDSGPQASSEIGSTVEVKSTTVSSEIHDKPPTPPIVEEPSGTVIEPNTPAPKAVPSVPTALHLFRQDYEVYFLHRNKVPAPWDAKEATQLSRWMKANPTITREQWRELLNNRSRSPVTHSKPLSAWIRDCLCWLNGMADDWGKAPNGNGGKSFDRNTRAVESVRAHRAQYAGNRTGDQGSSFPALFGPPAGAIAGNGSGLLAGPERPVDGAGPPTGRDDPPRDGVLAVPVPSAKTAGDPEH